jgi:prolyl oligopeptidase
MCRAARMFSRQGSDGAWTRKALPVPDNQSVDIVAASRKRRPFLMSVEGFLTPPSLWLGDAGDGSFALAKSQKPQFDSSGDVVEQFQATSKDGTKIPYFVVHHKAMRNDGSNATLLTAYGGFQVSNTPNYTPVTGKLWLERGGVYVLANIRGGGEFGPAWHEAGLKTTGSGFTTTSTPWPRIWWRARSHRRTSWASWADRTAGF